MKKMILQILIGAACILFASKCSSQVAGQVKAAEDSIYTYHSGIVVDRKVVSPTDEQSRFYFYSDGRTVQSMRAEMYFKNYSAVFTVDSITFKQMDSVNSYFAVEGKFHIDGAVYPGGVLIIRELAGPKRTIFIYIKQNVYTFYN